MSTKSSKRTLAARAVAAALVAAFAMLAVGCTSEIPAPTGPGTRGTPQQE